MVNRASLALLTCVNRRLPPEGIVLRDNRTMVKFVRAPGFELAPVPEEPSLLRVVRRL